MIDKDFVTPVEKPPINTHALLCETCGQISHLPLLNWNDDMKTFTFSSRSIYFFYLNTQLRKLDSQRRGIKNPLLTNNELSSDFKLENGLILTAIRSRKQG